MVWSSSWFSRVGDQLELDLFPGEPWAGRSPRALTRGRLGLIFNARGAGRELRPDPLQLPIWPVSSRRTKKKAVSGELTAPLLVPLGSRRVRLDRWRDLSQLED